MQGPLASVVRGLVGAQAVVVFVEPVPGGFSARSGIRPRRWRRRHSTGTAALHAWGTPRIRLTHVPRVRARRDDTQRVIASSSVGVPDGAAPVGTPPARAWMRSAAASGSLKSSKTCTRA